MVVDDTTFKVRLPERKKPSQMDRLEPLLKDKPRKKVGPAFLLKKFERILNVS